MPELTPGSVAQLLEVLDRAHRNHTKQGAAVSTAYQDAVRHVAQRKGVTYQTIGDLCRRRLGLGGIDEFFHLLDQWFSGDSDPLRGRILRYASGDTHSIVKAFFDRGSSPGGTEATVEGSMESAPNRRHPITALPQAELRLRIDSELMQRLQLAHLAGVGATLEDTAVALLDRGFAAERGKVRQYLDDAVG
jgi:hypothetical protein